MELLGCWESSFPRVEACVNRDPPMAAHHALMLCYRATVAPHDGATDAPLRLQVSAPLRGKAEESTPDDAFDYVSTVDDSR